VTRALGIDFISVFGLPPVEFVTLAAELKCQHISIALTPMPGNPHNYPLWSLRDDAGLRRDFVAAQREHGVTVSLGEGFLIWPQKDIRDAEADIALMREIGAPAVNILVLDPDWSHGVGQLAAFADMAAANGMQATLEFMPGIPVGTLASAATAIREANRPNLRLLLDSMHVFRSGASVAEVAALDPELIGYVQLCDAPVTSDFAYGDEARFHRRPPGEGELPLKDFIAALPSHLMLGLEIPMLGEAEAGIGPHQRLARCVAATRALLTAPDKK
jgi:sugar phosphate isomerase/epimerase